MPIQVPPIYCAFRSLFQWKRTELALHRALMRQLSPESVRTALVYFRVARNFTGIERPENAQYIVSSLILAESRRDLSPIQRVSFLAERLQQRFNNRSLSAASKLLWLRHRRPYVILDSRAQIALHRLGRHFDRGDYSQYVRAWREQYAEIRPSIARACRIMVSLPGVATSLFISRRNLSRLVSQPWFQERTFDVYLWERGGNL